MAKSLNNNLHKANKAKKEEALFSSSLRNT